MAGWGATPDIAWFDALLTEILPPPQKAIIDALIGATGPLSEAEIQAALEKRGLGDLNAAGVRYHVKRLRKLDAIEVDPSSTTSRQVRYRLTEKPGRAPL